MLRLPYGVLAGLINFGLLRTGWNLSPYHLKSIKKETLCKCHAGTAPSKEVPGVQAFLFPVSHVLGFLPVLSGANYLGSHVGFWYWVSPSPLQALTWRYLRLLSSCGVPTAAQLCDIMAEPTASIYYLLRFCGGFAHWMMALMSCLRHGDLSLFLKACDGTQPSGGGRPRLLGIS